MNERRAELDALLAEYRRDLPQTLARIESALAGARLAELGRALHMLAGSAGTYGLPRLGEAAAAAEAYLASCGASPNATQRAELARLLGLIRQASS